MAEGGRANLGQATVGDLIVKNENGTVEAGVVRTLSVDQPDVCPANINQDGPSSTVSVQAVSGGRLIFNGSEHPVQKILNDCGQVVIGSQE